MAEVDAYVLPIDHGVVAARRRLFVILTVVQVAVAVIAPVLIGVLVRSVAVALVALLIMGVVLVLSTRKDTERWRAVRAITEYPPVFAAEGLRLRAVSTSGYDLLVPWSQVTRIVATPRGQRWNLAVHIDGPGELAAADLAELDDVVRRHSDGRLSVESGLR